MKALVKFVTGCMCGVAVAMPAVAEQTADDELRAFERKVGVSGGDVWAGIPRHPAVVNPPVRAAGTRYISLAGEWELIMRPHGAVAGRSLQEIQYGIRWGGQRNKWYASSGTDTVYRVAVPGCWEASGIGEPGKGVPHLCYDSIEQELRHFYAGACWYRKEVPIPSEWKGNRLWLKVGGIRSRGWCYVNGHAVALCDAGIGAWKWEITDFAKPGETALVMICADNAVAARGGISNSKNRWGGIVRDIEIEATPETFIDDAWVRGDFDAKCAELHVTIGRAVSTRPPIGAAVSSKPPYQIRLTIDGQSVSRALGSRGHSPSQAASPSSSPSPSTFTLELPLRNFRPWSPAHPNLYTARVDLVAADGKVVHSRLERFGVRKLEVRGKDFYLNDKPFYIRGCGDNAVYPATGVSPADKVFHLAHLKVLKAAGFNYVRMHTHYEQPEFFDAADEAGVLLAPELAYYADDPNDHFDYDPLRDAYDAFVALRRNVSYAVRGVGNEGTLGPAAGRLIYRFHKELDPGSLAIEQDGGSYLRPDWGRGTSDFANGPLTSWRRGAIDPPVPLVAHEYLNLAAKADCRDEAKWSGILAPPMTRSQRRTHLAHTGLSDAWLDLLQDAQHALQKYWQKNGIEAARADPFCDGYVFWTVVDSTVFNKASGVYTAQGLFTPFWQAKRCGTTVAEAAVYNSPSCLLIDNDGPADRRGEPYSDGLVYCSFGVGVREATNRVYAAGEEIPLDIMLSHYDEDLEIADGRLTWRFVTPDGATLVAGEKSVGVQPRGPMRILERMRVRVPDVKKPVKATLLVSLAGISNSWDFWFFPKVENSDDPAEVVVADYGSEAAEAARRAGKNLLVVGNRSDKANFTMGWWWLGKQVGTVVKVHPCLGDFPYEPFLTPLLFRVIKEGEALPVAGYAEEDYVIVGEGLKDAYLYLAAKVRPDGGREIYVSGLDISGATPESASLRANLMRWLTQKGTGLAEKPALAGAAMADTVVESAREIPVAADVDVVVVGGTASGVSAAVAASDAGARVFLAGGFPYLGEDMAGTLELQCDKGPSASALERRLCADSWSFAPYAYDFENGFRYFGGWQYFNDGKDKLSTPTPPSGVCDSVLLTNEASVVCTLHDRRKIASIEVVVIENVDERRPAALSVDHRGKISRDAGPGPLTGDVSGVILEGDQVGREIAFERDGDVVPADGEAVRDGEPEDLKSTGGEAKRKTEQVLVVYRAKVDANLKKVRVRVSLRAGAACQLLSRIRFCLAAADKSCSDPSPLKVKRTFDAVLAESGVTAITGSPVTDILADGSGELAGVVIANRSGRQAIRAKCVVDATRYGVVGRLGRPLPGTWGKTTFTRVIVSGGRPDAPGVAVEALPGGRYIDHVRATEAYGEFAGMPVTGRVWRCTFELPMADGSYPSFAKAECLARDLLWSPTTFDPADQLRLVTPLPRESERKWLWTVPDDRPLGVRIAAGAAAGREAAAAARRRSVLRDAAVSSCPARVAADGEVREALGGLRPYDRLCERLGSVASPARELPVLGDYDIVVVGGGTAGAPAAISAAREGVRTLVVEYLHLLGGVGSDGTISGFYDGNRVGFVEDYMASLRKTGGEIMSLVVAESLRRMCRDAGADIWFGAFGEGVYVKGGSVAGVVVVTPFGRGVVRARCVIDATGNADVAAAAGARTTFIGARELALQSAGQAPHRLGRGGVNTDFGYVNDPDAWDLWLFGVRSRAGAPDPWDIQQMVDSRERRRIVPDLTLEGWDVIAGRKFPDTVNRSKCRQDSHGFFQDDYGTVAEVDGVAVRYANIPLRSYLPQGVGGMAVIGLGKGVARDVVPFTRMRADLINEGFAIGLCAAEAVRSAHGDFRAIDVKKVQRRLVAKGNLPPEVLDWKDDPELSDAELARVVAGIGNGYRGSGYAFRYPKRALPLLRDCYRAATAAEARQAYAIILGLLGDATGAETLSALLDGKVAFARLRRGIGYCGEAYDRIGLSIALGRTKSPQALAPLVRQLQRVDPVAAPFRALRAATLGLEALGDPKAARPLAEALGRPGVGGWARAALKDLPPLGGYGVGSEMERCLRELALARALYACGDFEGLGRRTLEAYARDPRGTLAEHANAVLEAYRPPNALSRASDGFASQDPRVRRFALNELFEKDPAAAIAKAKTMTGDPDEIVQLYLASFASSIKDKKERSAFIGDILAKTTYASVVKEAERRGGFPFFRNNVAKSRNPANDHDMTLVKAVPLPTEGWAFATDPRRSGHLGATPFQGESFDDASWKRIRIGDFWEKQGFDGYDGIAWYRVSFSLPEKPTDVQSSELCFDAVDEEAWVWLNGVYLGQHAEGASGWDVPFRLGADDELKWGGVNTLVVRVGDSKGGGGIWKGVRVEALK